MNSGVGINPKFQGKAVGVFLEEEEEWIVLRGKLAETLEGRYNVVYLKAANNGAVIGRLTDVNIIKGQQITGALMQYRTGAIRSDYINVGEFQVVRVVRIPETNELEVVVK
ncbi:MAG: hypothetical protein [aquatic viral metagenome]